MALSQPSTPSWGLQHSQTIAGLSPSTTYYFRVRPQDGSGNLATSKDLTFTTAAPPDTTPPGDVTNFQAVAGNGQLSLSWTNPTDTDFAGVMIRYRTDGVYPTGINDGTLAVDHQPGSPGASVSFLHRGLTNGVTYSYAGFTYDRAGNYSQTAFTQATPMALPPPNSPPVATASAGPTNGRAPLTVSFAGNGTDSDGTIVFYSWDFGDGTSTAWRK